MSSQLIDRISAIVRRAAACPAPASRAPAGLHANSLRRLGEPDWNPTADTLIKLERFVDSGGSSVIVSPEQIIDEARNGRMFILGRRRRPRERGRPRHPRADGDARCDQLHGAHGRGLICLALAKTRVAQLGLLPMSQSNGTRMETAFTVSIEARHGVTTGISAADRARTIAVAIDAGQPADAIVTPGHVFPLAARDGGVLVRAGHTEAAVDISRLAGLNPSGVICEIMRDDGTMARMDDLVAFASAHNLKIGTIRDLIAYRMKHDHLVEETASAPFSRAGAAAGPRARSSTRRSATNRSHW
jgi:3,4-dihydroxy 2-butanone 4-phosphate synthase/GTP cyclohydrolase II